MIANSILHPTEYVPVIQQAQDLDDLTSRVQQIIEQLSFTGFSYWLRQAPTSNRQSIALATYPDEYSKHYMKNKYYLHDMIGLMSANHSLPFCWNEIEQHFSITPMQEKLFDESASVGMTSGGCVPIYGAHNSHAVFSVVSDQSIKGFEQWFNVCKYDLHIIALHTHEKVVTLDGSSGQRVVSMTMRELEVLSWVSRGKTYWEIGRILNIQEDTVKKHMKKACTLLDAANSSQAVAKAVYYGLITP